MALDTRLDRYANFIEKGYLPGLLKFDEYSLEGVSEDLRRQFADGKVRRIVFTGMGCSAIVSDVIRGFFAELGTGPEIYVANDYDFTFLLPRAIIDDPETVIIVSSYSGHSREPLLAYRKLAEQRDRVLLLTSGGSLAEEGAGDGASIAYWRLRTPDREYPLFHVAEYFAILLDLFARLGLLDDNRQAELAQLSHALQAELSSPQSEELSTSIAERSREANLILLGSPRWHESLLKLAKMHFNEMAMVPTARNYFHEFCHSEVATLSSAERRHSLIRLVDPADDEYTIAKGKNLDRLLSEERPENDLVEVSHITLDKPTFLHKFFYALGIIQKSALKLGRYREVDSRNLISEAAGNSWYHSDTIESELRQTA